MPLEIQIKKSPDEQHVGPVVVHLKGSLDTATAPELEQQLATIWQIPFSDLVFNLAQLNFISSAGLRVFANARKRQKERNGQASFVNMQPQVKDVFEIIKALPGVSVFSSDAELDAYLIQRQIARQQARSGK
jgi:anti-anti-sigma factor